MPISQGSATCPRHHAVQVSRSWRRTADLGGRRHSDLSEGDKHKGLAEPHAGDGRGDKSVRRRAESQWIVAARLLCHLQYPATYLSRLQRIHLPNRLELPFRAPGAAASAASGGTLDTCSRGRTSAPTISRVTTGEVESAASSMDSDLEAFSHNPTHGSFAPLAFQPSAMTNYVNQRFLSY